MVSGEVYLRMASQPNLGHEIAGDPDSSIAPVQRYPSLEAGCYPPGKNHA